MLGVCVRTKVPDQLPEYYVTMGGSYSLISAAASCCILFCPFSCFALLFTVLSFALFSFASSVSSLFGTRRSEATTTAADEVIFVLITCAFLQLFVW